MAKTLDHFCILTFSTPNITNVSYANNLDPLTSSVLIFNSKYYTKEIIKKLNLTCSCICESSVVYFISMYIHAVSRSVWMAVCSVRYISCMHYLQYWSLLNWRNLRFLCGCVAVPVNWIFVIISSCFAILKNVVHSLEPGETPSYSASHQAPNYVQRS